jgi:hypothetical protein
MRTDAPDPQPVEAVDEPLVRHRGLVAVCVLGAAVESAALHVTGPVATLSMAPQVTATPPFGAFHDLRWLLSYHPSWVAFGLELLALLAFRGALTALTVRLAWPRSRVPPDWQHLLRRGVIFTAGASLVLLPWSLLLFSVAAMPVSWLFLASLPPVVLTAVMIHRGAVTKPWWQLPTLRTITWTLASFAVLTAGGAATVLLPAGLGSLLAALTGLFNAWAWYSIVHGLVEEAPRRVRRPLTPVALASILAVAFGGAAIAFALLTPDRRPPLSAPAPLPTTGRPVLVARGYGSEYRGGPFTQPFPGHIAVPFSYRGVTSDGRPAVYAPADTHRALGELVTTMDQQVRDLHAATGEPVDIVAVSEGTLVAKAWAATAQNPPVSHLVLLSPLIAPAKVYYPMPGRDGWSAATAIGLEGLTRLIGLISNLDPRASLPLIRSVVVRGPLMRDLMSCPSGNGIEDTLVIPLDSAMVTDPGATAGLHVRVRAEFHAATLNTAAGRGAVTAILDDRPALPATWERRFDRAIRAAAAAWQAPPVPVSLPPAWHGLADTGPGENGTLTCPELRRRLARSLQR